MEDGLYYLTKTEPTALEGGSDAFIMEIDVSGNLEEPRVLFFRVLVRNLHEISRYILIPGLYNLHKHLTCISS